MEDCVFDCRKNETNIGGVGGLRETVDTKLATPSTNSFMINPWQSDRNLTIPAPQRGADITLFPIVVDRHSSKQGYDLLWVKVQMRPVNLIEPPQQIFRRAIHVVASAIIRKVTT